MRTVAQALSSAKAESSKASRDWTGYCLAFVRACWGYAATGIPDANAAWRISKTRHTSGTAPAGAPVYWSVGQHGHVALSAGGGRVYSTDIRRKGKVDLVPVGEIAQKWGARYLGWTGDYAGRGTLPLAVPQVSLKAIVAAAKQDPGRGQGGQTAGSPDDVRLVEDALRREGLLQSTYAGDGSFGTLTVRAYRRWQTRLGYSGKDADGIPGQKSLTALGAKHGFKVVS